jgi:hypothetical protein
MEPAGLEAGARPQPLPHRSGARASSGARPFACELAVLDLADQFRAHPGDDATSAAGGAATEWRLRVHGGLEAGPRFRQPLIDLVRVRPTGWRVRKA